MNLTISPGVREAVRSRVPFVRLPLVAWRHRGLRPTDAFLVSYMRSGQTWTRMMLGELLSGAEVDFDTYQLAVPMIGTQSGVAGFPPGGRRIIASHEPLHRWSARYPKVVMLIRDGRDVALSLYHDLIARGRLSGSFDDFLVAHLAGKYGGHGRWDEHIRDWSASPQARAGNLLSVRYEALLEEPLEQIREIARFLNLPHDDDTLQTAIEHNRVERMQTKERESDDLAQIRDASKGGMFVRGAHSGGREQYFTPENEARFERAFGGIMRELGYL